MRVLKSVHLVFLLGLVSACNDDDEDCTNRICEPDKGDPPGLSLQVLVSPAPAGGTVRVEVYSGSEVEHGTLIHSWETSGGDPSRTLNVSEGDYSGHAMYARPGDTLDAFDADDATLREFRDDCECHAGWFADNGTIDLREK
jgi:hypothetical protein